jgi:hypothetical protein
VAGDTRSRRRICESTEESSGGAACDAGATALRHFVVDMVALRENLHDRTVRRAGADEQGRDYRVRPDLAGAGSYPGISRAPDRTALQQTAARGGLSREGASPTVASAAHLADGVSSQSLTI